MTIKLFYKNFKLKNISKHPKLVLFQDFFFTDPQLILFSSLYFGREFHELSKNASSCCPLSLIIFYYKEKYGNFQNLGPSHLKD
ncbi:hypothetical protein BpHYR1_005319 [Brachionus plicatilis]|uniref:Uncharacterized protein n=1 Tax=Brachionus plicatilis TaxID=10195 RepID=A0A3M7QAM1_BRAPC|nr:hypothetical protein BpHYR1_005319 [Brachionus plicatilis]